MRRVVTAAVLLVLAVQGAEGRPASTLQTQPYTYIRTLQTLQARVAGGSQPAQRLQLRLLEHIAARFAEMPLAAWRARRNASAAVLFVLSGGRPDAVRHLVAGDRLEPPYGRLLEGALAYVDGRRDAAIRLLKEEDGEVLPDGLAGHLALIRAVLVRNKDLKAAQKLLDRARLLMPATLVEEAALRRGVVLSGEDGDRDGFVARSAVYLRNFGGSVYAPEFERSFARLAVALEFTGMPDAQARLEQIAGPLEAEVQLRFYLEVARTAMIGGDRKLTQFAATQATTLTQPDTDDGRRAQLYLAAARIVTGQREQALAVLRGLDPTALEPADRAIVAAATRLASELERWPLMVDRPLVNPHGDGAGAGEPSASPDENEVFARAEALFDQVDTMIEGAGK